MRKVTYIIDDEKGFNKILNGKKYDVKDPLKLIYTLTQEGSDIRYTLTDFNENPVNINSLNGYQSMFLHECFNAFTKDTKISEEYKDFIEIKENVIIKEYDVEVKEILSKVVSIKTGNIDEALDKAESMYDNSEIELNYEDLREREFTNLYSKKLSDPFNININFKDGILTIQQNDNKEKTYSCDKVRNISNCLNSYLNEFIEEHNIDSKQGHQIEIELGNEEDLEMEK